MSENLSEKIGISVKGVWTKEQVIINLKDNPMSRRSKQLVSTDGKPMTIRSITFVKFVGANNKILVELEKLVPAK